jgi:hypothetical protein
MVPMKGVAGFAATVAVVLCTLIPFTSAQASSAPVASSKAPHRARLLHLAQATPAPQAAPAAPATAPPESIGTVVTLQGSATVTRAGTTRPLKLNDEIFSGDTLRTAANGALGITLDDETTFNLGAGASMVMDNLVYQSGGTANAGLFNVARGTVAFVAGQVAKTGNMQIGTPTATLGIRGTTGVIEVPANATAPGDVAIKLYNDADGRLGRIEVFAPGPNGPRLGLLDRAASGFAIRRGAGGTFGAFALQISPQQAARDRGFVGQLFRTHDRGRQLVVQRRAIRQQLQQRGPNPQRGLNPPRGLRLQGPGVQPRQPGNLRQPNPPPRPQRRTNLRNPSLDPSAGQPQLNQRGSSQPRLGPRLR